jgi:hypothetical protein
MISDFRFPISDLRREEAPRSARGAGVDPAVVCREQSPDSATAEDVAREIGFSLSPVRQFGGVRVEGMSAEEYAAFAAELPEFWEFTDRRFDSATRGLTFYVPVGTSREEILERYQEKLDAELASQHGEAA